MFPASLTKATVTVALVAFLAVVPTQSADAASRDDPPTDKIAVDFVAGGGSGCLESTTRVAVSPDNTELTLVSDRYLAQVGVGATKVDFRKNCLLKLIIHVPQGYSYAIPAATYRGFAHLEAGASATVRTNYHFQGNPAANTRHSFRGPLDDYWTVEDHLDPASQPWTPCGELRYLTIDTDLTVSAGTSDPTKTTSYISMDDRDVPGGATYNLAWKRCPTD
jgi:hypothetical protein